MLRAVDQLVDTLVQNSAIKTALIEQAFRSVDRADFVPEAFCGEAYVDEALFIGHGQTISQPYTVAFMFELLDPKKGERILDIGSGSGWTTALLASCVGEKGAVFGVERVLQLVEMGQKNLAKYQFPHASIAEAGDMLGLPKQAPFDRILVSATSDDVPSELLLQLRVGGVLVLPVHEAIWRVEKKSENDLHIQKHEGFAFVPLIGP